MTWTFTDFLTGESGVGCNIFVKYSYNSFNIGDKIKLRILLNRHEGLQYMTLSSDGKEVCFRLYWAKNMSKFCVTTCPRWGMVVTRHLIRKHCFIFNCLIVLRTQNKCNNFKAMLGWIYEYKSTNITRPNEKNLSHHCNNCGKCI